MKNIQSSSNYDNLKELQFFNEILYINHETLDEKVYYTSLGESSVYFEIIKHKQLIGEYVAVAKIGYSYLNVIYKNNFDPIQIYERVKCLLTGYVPYELIPYAKELRYFLQFYKDQYERYVIYK